MVITSGKMLEGGAFINGIFMCRVSMNGIPTVCYWLLYCCLSALISYAILKRKSKCWISVPNRRPSFSGLDEQPISDKVVLPSSFCAGLVLVPTVNPNTEDEKALLYGKNTNMFSATMNQENANNASTTLFPLTNRGTWSVPISQVSS